jgi:hypothetical protein
MKPKVFYKCIKGSSNFTLGGWYELAAYDPEGPFAFIDNTGQRNGWSGTNHTHFDLNNPRYEGGLINKMFTTNK